MNQIHSNQLSDQPDMNEGSLDPIICKRDDLEDSVRINTTPRK